MPVHCRHTYYVSVCISLVYMYRYTCTHIHIHFGVDEHVKLIMTIKLTICWELIHTKLSFIPKKQFRNGPILPINKFIPRPGSVSEQYSTCLGNSVPPSSGDHRLSVSVSVTNSVTDTRHSCCFLSKDEQKCKMALKSFLAKLYSGWREVGTVQIEKKVGEGGQNAILDLCLPGIDTYESVAEVSSFSHWVCVSCAMWELGLQEGFRD